MTNFRDQLAQYIIGEKYKVAKVYMQTGKLLDMKPCSPFVRLMFNGNMQTEYSRMMDKRVRIFNDNWERK